MQSNNPVGPNNGSAKAKANENIKYSTVSTQRTRFFRQSLCVVEQSYLNVRRYAFPSTMVGFVMGVTIGGLTMGRSILGLDALLFFGILGFSTAFGLGLGLGLALLTSLISSCAIKREMTTSPR